jgi:hypothetical protein
VRSWRAIRRIDSFTGNESGPKREAFPDYEACIEGRDQILEVLDLALQLARFTAGCQRGERKLLRRLAAPPTQHEVEAARNLARGHRPDIRRRIVGGDESVDRFC